MKNLKNATLNFFKSAILLVLCFFAFIGCNSSDRAFVKSDKCLKVYASPRFNSPVIYCLSNYTEVEVLKIERKDLVLSGEKGNFIIISYFDDEGNKRTGFIFDARLYYPGLSLQALIILTAFITFTASLLVIGSFLFVKNKLREKKLSKTKNSVKKSSKKKGKEKTPLNRKLIIGLGIAFLFVIIAVFLLIKRTAYFYPTLFSNRMDISEIEIKKRQLRRYARKYVRAMDYLNPGTRDYAAQLASKHPGKFSIQQICYIYDHVQKNWKYVNDPEGVEYISPASRTIKNKMVGDCDDFAVLLASMLKSIGGQTRIIYAIGEKSVHAYAEVKIKVDEDTISYVNKHYRNVLEKILDVNRIERLHTHKGYGGEWLNLDWSSKYPGGKYFKSNYNIIIYPKGYFIERKYLKE